MKKLFLLLFIMGSGFAYSQTTMDEYNYVTKGFKVQQSEGLGVKQGYSFVPKGTYSVDYGTYQLQVSVNYLMRTADNSFAAALVMVHNTKKNDTQYFCVPSKNSDQGIWNKTLTDIRAVYLNEKDKSKSDYAGFEAIMYAMMHLIGQ